jgi:hypothetical protein
MGVCAFPLGSDARCASLALSHLSLSLSLSSASDLASDPLCVPLSRATRYPPQGVRAVVAFSRRVSVLACGVGV